MSIMNSIYRLRHLLPGVMLAFVLAFMATAATSAEPLKLVCETGDQRCAGPSSTDSVLTTTVFLPIINNGGDTDVMAAADGTLYLCILEPDGNTK